MLKIHHKLFHLLRGIYSIDNLHLCRRDGDEPLLLVHCKVPKHWITLFFRANHVLFFDSMGKHPTDYHPSLSNFLSSMTVVSVLKQRIQLSGSRDCALWCLVFSALICTFPNVDIRLLTSIFHAEKKPVKHVQSYLFDNKQKH